MTTLIKTLATAAAVAVLATGALAQSAGDAGNPPVFGEAASNVSPRVGHLHVTVDDAPWRWADTGSGTDTIVVVELPPGPHKVKLELASPEHEIFTGKTVTFTVPETGSHKH